MSVTAEQIRAAVAPLAQYQRPRESRRKTYLSRADRDEALQLAAAAGSLDEIVTGWEERGRPGAARRAVKLARYWCHEALTEMLRDVEQESIDALLREAHRVEIVVDRRR